MMYGTHTARSVVATLSAIQKPLLEQHQLFRIFCTNSVSNFACREFGIIGTQPHIVPCARLALFLRSVLALCSACSCLPCAQPACDQLTCAQLVLALCSAYSALSLCLPCAQLACAQLACAALTEFKKLMCCLAFPYTDEHLQKMMDEIDVGGGGTVDFGEFAKMMTGQATSSLPLPLNLTLSLCTSFSEFLLSSSLALHCLGLLR